MTSILNFWVGLCQIKSYFLAEQPHENARKSQFIHPETKKKHLLLLFQTMKLSEGQMQIF